MVIKKSFLIEYALLIREILRVEIIFREKIKKKEET